MDLLSPVFYRISTGAFMMIARFDHVLGPLMFVMVPSSSYLHQLLGCP